MHIDLKRIAVAYGGTEACRVALERAVELAKSTGAGLDLISVGIPIVPLGGFGWVAPYEDTHHVDSLVRERVEEAASMVDPSIDTKTHACIGTPAPEIVATARSCGASLIVMGAVHHSQLERLFIGSTANRVIRLSRIPCLIASSTTPARRILAAADDSPFGESAIHAALSLAAATGAEVRCVHVAREPSDAAVKNLEEGLESHASELGEHLAAFVKQARERVADFMPDGMRPSEISISLRFGDVCEEILGEVRDYEADLLAVGTHGRGFVARQFLGSISEQLLERSPVSVLVAPGPKD